MELASHWLQIIPCWEKIISESFCLFIHTATDPTPEDIEAPPRLWKVQFAQACPLATTYQVGSVSIHRIMRGRDIGNEINSQIVGQVVLLKGVSLKAVRDCIKVLTSYSTDKTFGLQEERRKTCNDS